MEERLLALIRLAIKYGYKDISFYQNNNEMQISMGDQRVKTKLGDEKLIRFICYFADLDVSNLLTPQSGEFELEVDNKLIKFRAAIIQSITTKSCVLRILNAAPHDVPEDLKYVSTMLNNMINKQYSGLIVISGPTGSGKTTDAYNLLKTVKNAKIYSIEDPIEVYVDEIIQTQVNEEGGLPIETGIKQILRHDPDIIFVGEIRNEKAAKMALTAIETGHIVLTTMHASNSAQVIDKFLEFGVDKEKLYRNLYFVSNQRMVVNKNKNKEKIYEIMDYDEIQYYKDHNKNSRKFKTIKKKLKERGYC